MKELLTSVSTQIGRSAETTQVPRSSRPGSVYGHSADEIIGHNISVLIPDDRWGELKPVISCGLVTISTEVGLGTTVHVDIPAKVVPGGDS